MKASFEFWHGDASNEFEQSIIRITLTSLVWDVISAKQVGTLEAPGLYTWDGKQRIRSIGGVRSIAFLPDGTLLPVGWD